MPSPPAAVSSCHHRAPRRRWPSSSSVTSTDLVRRSRTGSARQPGGRSVQVPAVRAQRVDRSPAGQDLERGQAQVVHRVAPASSSGGRRRRTGPPDPRRCSMLRQQAGRVDAALARPVSRARLPPARRRGRGDRRVLAAQQLARLGRPRHQLAVEDQPVGVRARPRARPRRWRATDPVEQRALRSPDRRRTRARCGCRSRRHRPARRRTAGPRRRGPGRRRRPPASPCASPRRPPRRTPAARKAAKASLGCSSSPARPGVAVGDIVGGR